MTIVETGPTLNSGNWPASMPPPPPSAPRNGKMAKFIFGFCSVAAVGFAIMAVATGSTGTHSATTGGVASWAVHVPIPAGAVADQSPSSAATLYRLPTSYSFAALESFYAQNMPAGQSFHGLQWCDQQTTNTAGSTTVQLSWQKPSTTDFLLVSLISDPARGPSVLIYDDKNDSAC